MGLDVPGRPPMKSGLRVLASLTSPLLENVMSEIRLISTAFSLLLYD
jgi:hypothetical protein